MDCHTVPPAKIIFLSSHCSKKRVPWILWPLRKLDHGYIDRLKYMCYKYQYSKGRQSIHHISWQTCCTQSIPEEEYSSPQAANSSNPMHVDEFDMEEVLSQPLRRAELKSLMADSERAKLISKLSEANRNNRFLKRQLQEKDNELVNFKRDLAALDYEIQTLVPLAEEISKSPIPQGSRKINGKYIQSHLVLQLRAVNKKMKQQITGVDDVQSKEVHLFWSGMAESVQVMGSFDGWSQGEHLSPEFTGSYMKFQTTLMLRPGRYEIKFLVDGEWYLSPEFPTVGVGSLENNLLIVQ
ncbi:protein PTST, chloroplastic isoform X2 [Apium graveolens]|uniref:protein PTST, chloroplastic isoform X2 n=1 Tax=Apium graveolens TaxID=4045 RepID=UPI003D7B729E